MTIINHFPAPDQKVLPERNVISVGYGNKGLCLRCGELFNLCDDHLHSDICPECLEIFGDGYSFPPLPGEGNYRLKEAL